MNDAKITLKNAKKIKKVLKYLYFYNLLHIYHSMIWLSLKHAF